MKGANFLKIDKSVSLPSLNGYSLLMPSVSVGNVGQLAIDVLISTLKPTKVALVHHGAILPLIGCHPFDDTSSEVTTAADLHICEKRKLLILQIRSPLIIEERDSFLHDLASWAENQCLRDVIVLSSCHAHLRHDSQISGSQFRFVPNKHQHPHIDRLKEIGVPELERRDDDFGNKQKGALGTGFIYDFLDVCTIPAVSLMKFVDEGDNSRDALSLVSFLNSWTHYQDKDAWKTPPSWKNLFGPPPPSSIY